VKLIECSRSVETQYNKDNFVHLLVVPKAGFVYKLTSELSHSKLLDAAATASTNSAASATATMPKSVAQAAVAALKDNALMAPGARHSLSTSGSLLQRHMAQLSQEGDGSDNAETGEVLLTPVKMLAARRAHRPMSLRSMEPVRFGTGVASGAPIDSGDGTTPHDAPVLTSLTPVLPTAPPPTRTLPPLTLSNRAPPNKPSPPVPLDEAIATATAPAGGAGRLLNDVRVQITRTRSMTADNIFQVSSGMPCKRSMTCVCVRARRCQRDR
jgi:hypothetical protein